MQSVKLTLPLVPGGSFDVPGGSVIAMLMGEHEGKVPQLPVNLQPLNDAEDVMPFCRNISTCEINIINNQTQTHSNHQL